MNFRLIVFLLIFYSFNQWVSGQQETYSVRLAPFSSPGYDEFGPVYYKHGIVFCTDRKSGSVADYSSTSGKGSFKIYYVDTTGNVNSRKPWLFSKSLTTRFNDGPVTFNDGYDSIYYSRNLQVEGKLKDLSTPRNKLGIFTAVLQEKKWIKVRELRFNNEWYNISTPFLSRDGKRLFFASDKPEGFGGSDLYYSDLKEGYWSDPINLGPVINTTGNESYPFMNPSGELFFSSDGHTGGYGGKDIYFSRMKDNNWLPPVRLDPPVNSKFDDFGIITDSLISEGYFSSNRNKSLDIFHFKTNFPQIFYTDVQKENQYCFQFSDSGSISADTVFLKYVWDFGDSKKASGATVEHCFKGPGKYEVNLDLIDKVTGNLFFSKLSYSLDLKDIEQPYISSPDKVAAGDTVDFDGLKSFLPGYDILSYSWDFGDGTRLIGSNVRHSFREKGEYHVNLGLKMKSLSSGIIQNTGVSKKITVYSSSLELASFRTKDTSLKPGPPDIKKYENALIRTRYSAETEFRQDAEFRIELYLSKTNIGVNSSLFKGIPNNYEIKEVYDQDEEVYRYLLEPQMSLMATYPAYMDLVENGFKDVRIILSVIKDPAEQELYRLLKTFGTTTDSYFDNFNSLTSNAYIMLDQIKKLMNKYPQIKLEVEVTSDNTGIPDKDAVQSQIRAQLLVNNLINRGISAKRLVARGFGRLRPANLNKTAEERKKLNRRVWFTIQTH